MEEINEKLREEVKKLLGEKKVDLIIGYTKGSLPLQATPCFVRKEEEVNNLIFDVTCSNNLAVYLTKDRRPKTKDRRPIGIIAKGCDGRSIVQHIVEGQLKREEVVIIGVGCEGIIDLRKLREKTGGKEILKYQVNGENVLIEGRNFKKSLKKEDILFDGCLACEYPNPPVYDVFIGEPTSVIGNPCPRLRFGRRGLSVIGEKFEKMSSEERWKFFEKEISKCIRCYACRNACPLCYCEECFVDQTNPRWFGKSTDLSDTMIFHIVRLLHTAGRCVGCGACTRACPAGVNLAPLGIKLEKEIKERFAHTAGLDLESTPPMAAYKEDDRQEFIM